MMTRKSPGRNTQTRKNGCRKSSWVPRARQCRSMSCLTWISMTPDIGSKMHFRLCCSVKHIDEALATNRNPERHPELRRRAIKNLRSERAKFARAKKRAAIPQPGNPPDLPHHHEKTLLRPLPLPT